MDTQESFRAPISSQKVQLPVIDYRIMDRRNPNRFIIPGDLPVTQPQIVEWYVHTAFKMEVLQIHQGEVDLDFLRLFTDSHPSSLTWNSSFANLDYLVNVHRGVRDFLLEEYETLDANAIYLRMKSAARLDFTDCVLQEHIVEQAIIREWSNSLSMNLLRLSNGSISFKYSKNRFFVILKPTHNEYRSFDWGSKILNLFRFPVSVELHDESHSPVSVLRNFQYISAAVNEHQRWSNERTDGHSILYSHLPQPE